MKRKQFIELLMTKGDDNFNVVVNFLDPDKNNIDIGYFSIVVDSIDERILILIPEED